METASDEQLPDWLLEIGDTESDTADAPQPAASTQFGDQLADNLDDLSWDTDDSDDTSQPDAVPPVAVPPVADAVPDWLSGLSEDSDTLSEEADEIDFADLGIAADEQVDQVDQADQADQHLQDEFTIGDETDADFDEFVAEFEDPDAQPSWLAALGPIDSQADAPPEHPIEHLESVRDAVSNDFDEDIDDLEAAFSDETVSDGETLDVELDWMLEDEESEPEFVAQFGELPRLDAAEEEEDDLIFSEESADADDSDFDFDFDFEAETDAGTGDSSLRSLGLADEIEPVPASNAPDWLNAMVPGLDLDYDAAAEDDFSDEVFAAAEETSDYVDTSGDYEWLTEIVDEELRPPVTLPEPVRPARETAAPREESRQRFSFDRAPAWMRRLKNRTEDSPADDDDGRSGTSGGTGAAVGAAGVAGAAGAGLMFSDSGDTNLNDADADLFDDDLFDDDLFNSADLTDSDFSLDDLDDDSISDIGDFDPQFTGSDFDPGDDFDLDDDDETDLPPWLRLDGDE